MTWKLLPNFRPLGVTAEWLAAAEAQEGQCHWRSKPRRAQDPRHQCNQFLNGGVKMYQWSDGHLYCAKHFDQLRREARKA